VRSHPNDRIRAVYQLTARDRPSARAKAEDMIVEQTVEVPADCVPRQLRRTIVGTIEHLERVGSARWRVACSYDVSVVGDSILQLFNLLFGNISMLAGIRLVELHVPPVPGLPGPTFGIPGLRTLTGAAAGPLLCAAAKPVGLSPAGLARMPTVDVHFKGSDGFFATANQVTVYARPWRLVGLMHSNWLPELATDLFFDSPGYVQYFPGVGTLGLHITYLNLGENVRIDELGDTLGFFPSFEGSIGLSFGTRLSSSIAFGWTGKFILSKLADAGAGKEQGKGQGTSFALDAGLLYQTPIKRLTIGAALTNLGPKIQYIDAAQADPLPRNLAIGFSCKLLESAYNKLTLLADLNRDLVSRDTRQGFLKSVFNESIENFGLEYWYGSYFAGRVGYVYDPDGQLKYPTLGSSLQYRNFRFDLAYVPSSKNLALANTLRLALLGKF